MKHRRLVAALIAVNLFIPIASFAQGYRIGTASQLEDQHISTTVNAGVTDGANAGNGNKMFRWENGVKIIMTPPIEGCDVGLAYSPGHEV